MPLPENNNGKHVQVEVASLGDAEEDNATVEAKILQLRKNKGTMKLVVGRPLQTGDVAIVDFNTVRTDTGEAIQGSERKGMQLDTGLGDRAIGLVGVCMSIIESVTSEMLQSATEPQDRRACQEACTSHFAYYSCTGTIMVR